MIVILDGDRKTWGVHELSEWEDPAHLSGNGRHAQRCGLLESLGRIDGTTISGKGKSEKPSAFHKVRKYVFWQIRRSPRGNLSQDLWTADANTGVDPG